MIYPIVSVVLGSYNRLKYLKLTIASIREELKNESHEIIVVDGGSTDGSLAWLTKQKDILLVVQHNRGVWQGKPIERRSWGYFMNLAFKSAQGKYVCMLSDDCLVIPGAIQNGIRYFDEQLDSGKKIGAVAFYFRDWPTQKKYHVCCTPADYLYVNHGLYLNQALKDVNYADEENYQFYGADTGLCLRMRLAGYEIMESPDSYIEHYAHANTKVRSSNETIMDRDLEAQHRIWQDIMIDKVTGARRPSAILEKDYQDPNNFISQYKLLHITNLGGVIRSLMVSFVNLAKRHFPDLVIWVKKFRNS